MQKKTLEALETMRYIIWESQIGKAEYGTEQTTNYYTVYMGIFTRPGALQELHRDVLFYI